MTELCKNLKVAVLMGGVGSEREISLESGRCVVEALQQSPWEILAIDIHPDSLDCLDDPSINVFFPALHGVFGEDGQLQGELEQRQVSYVGSSPAACSLTFDKMATKQVATAAGVPTPEALTYTLDCSEKELMETLLSWGQRWIVKPICQGSSVGVSIVENVTEALAAARAVHEQFGDCMVEQFVAGRELTVGVLLGETLPVIEVCTQQDFYDYQAKYEDDQTQYLFDTLPADATQELQAYAATCFSTLGLRHFGRIDFMLDEDEHPWLLEANAIPGLTSHSLLPKGAQRMGTSMADMCRYLVEAALPSRAMTRNNASL
ncbi:D-alanine--D-alanine ligase [Planctomycetota bacterium]